jgi:hypothetical protein
LFVSDVKPFGGTDTKLRQSRKHRIDVHDEVRIEMVVLFCNSKQLLD